MFRELKRSPSVSTRHTARSAECFHCVLTVLASLDSLSAVALTSHTFLPSYSLTFRSCCYCCDFFRARRFLRAVLRHCLRLRRRALRHTRSPRIQCSFPLFTSLSNCKSPTVHNRREFRAVEVTLFSTAIVRNYFLALKQRER